MLSTGAAELDDLKLLSLDIYKCSKEGEVKSALKEIASLNLARATAASTKIQEFMKLQFESKSREQVTTDEINNALLFIKTLVELPVTTPSAQLEEGNCQAGESSTLLENDPIYFHVLKPAVHHILNHMNTVIYSYCQDSVNELTSSDSNALSTHQLLALVHKTVRTTICLLKRIVSVPASELTQVGVSIRPHLRTLEDLLSELMRNSVFELPLDVKCNAGLVLAYSLKIGGGERLEKLETLKNVFTKHPNQDELGREFLFLREMCDAVQFEVNRIAIMFGVLGVAGTLDVHFEQRMKILGEFILSIDHGTKESINLGTGRVLEIWVEKMAHASPSTMEALSFLYTELEFFIFSNITSHIDAVKNCCRNVLRNLTRMYDKMEDVHETSLVKGLLERVLGKPFHVKWVGVSCVSVSTPKSICILEIEKDMPEELLSSERTLKHCASDAYLALMSHHFAKAELSTWESTWLDPLFREQISKTAESNWPQKRIIISLILKSNQDSMIQAVLKFIIRRMNSLEATSTCVESSLLAAEAVKIASELQVKIDLSLHQSGPIDSDSFRGIVPRKILHSWLWSSSPEVRLAGFSLLVETKKTSELIPAADLESLKILIQYNSVCQEPAFRQQFMSYYKKMLKRVRDSRALIVRNKDAANLKNYDDFFIWLWNCFTEKEGLFPGANFGRRCQALECLIELITAFDLSYLNVLSSNGLKYLRWLSDSYENNKAMAFRILEKMDIPELKNTEISTKLFETALTLCESIKPPDSLTARYLCIFLIKRCPESYSAWKILATAYEKLSQLYEDIHRFTLIEIASKTQMYGYFRIIRMIFDDTKDFVQNVEKYRQYTETLIELCFKYDTILLPVLGSAAPEGFLPGLPDSEPQNSQVVRSINAQMLLVCSWRTMKDVCLLLTEMCVVLPLEGEAEEFILSYDQVVSIGDHLLYLLKNLMHRGVFEQVYIGFRQLAQRLFKSSSRKLNELPEKWLNGAMDEELISSKCMTRRSAGLPFIFQALLAPVSSNEVFIAKYVNRLFEHDKISDSGLVQIHCTNVLRGLFKDANFSRAIMPYVPQGLHLAFKGLKATDWNERNAGLMLFGAVIRRTFGPKLNLMSAPTFFRKFPEMYDFLLAEIKKCCLTLRSGLHSVAADFTYHVLILLSSFASKGVVEDGHFKLAEFIPYIHFCGSSPDSQVRSVAARALIPFLIHPDSKINFILDILEKTGRGVGLSSNAVHGNLVQVLTILETIPAEDQIAEVTKTFNGIFMKSPCWLLNSKCPMVYEVLADICVKLGSAVKPSHFLIQKQFAATFPLEAQQRAIVPGLPNADEKLSRAKVLFAIDGCLEAKAVFDLLHSYHDHSSLEQLLTVLYEKKYLHERLDDNDSVVLESVIETYLQTNFEYVAQSTTEESFLVFLSQVDSRTYADWADYTELDVNQLFEKLYQICVQGFGTLECKEAALIILGKLVFGTSYDLTKWHTPFCETLTSWCDPVAESDLRYAVACCIPVMPYGEFDSFTVLDQCKIWSCILTLSQDDDSFIRAEVNSKLNQVARTCDRKSTELFLELYLETFAGKHSFEALVLLVGLVLRDDFAIKMAEADDADEERLFDRSEMNNYNEPVLFAKLVISTLLKYPDQVELFKTHFHETVLSSELLTFYESVTNFNLESLENMTLKSLCKFDPPKHELTDFSDFCNPASETSHIQAWTHQSILKIFT